MEYEITAVNRNGEQYDLSDVVVNLSWKTELYDQVGELEFSYIDQEGLDLKEGSAITFKVKDEKYGDKIIFFGMLVSRSWGEGTIRNKKGKAKTGGTRGGNYLDKTTVTCYDLMWHLRRDCIIKISRKEPYKPWEAFNYICKNFLKGKDSNYRITEDAKKVNIELSSEIQDKMKMSDAITGLCKKTLIKTNGKDFLYVYDEGRCLVLDRIPTLESGGTIEKDPKFKDMLILGDGSGIVSFQFSSSITDGGYNRVNLFNERGKLGKGSAKKGKKGTGKRVDKVAENKQSIEMFGEIPYTEKVDDALTEEQLNELAKNKLALFSMPHIELRLECLGELFSRGQLLRAGSVVGVDISLLKEKENVKNNQLFVIDKITHSFSYKKHMMSIDLRSLLSDKYSIGRVDY